MASQDRIVCTKCRGDNDRGARFCWYCGAPLGGGARRSGIQQLAIEVATRASKWLLFLGLLAGLVVGAYYALERYVWPAVNTETTTLVQTATTSTASTTTTTTLPPRTDRSVAAGADRYATAIAISELAFPDGAPALVLVPGDDHAQALAIAPLAAAYDGAVLLLPPDGIREDLANEIQRLAPAEVFLVATPRPSSITQQLGAILREPAVTRLIGGDAYETAALVADAVKAKVGAVSKVVVVPVESFIEGLTVAPLAAANGWPILLCPKDGPLPRATKNAIKNLEATSALLVGLDTEVALEQVETQLGADGYETASLVIRYAAAHGSTFTHTAIATGTNFPDGLVVGAYLALDRGILILAADDEQLPAPVLSLLNANLDDVRMLDFIALPALARQLAAKRPAGSSTTVGSGATTTATGSGATATSEPAGESQAQTTSRPSAGGW